MEKHLTAEQCQEIADRIIERFYRNAAGGTQYGVDWPTARVLWPTLCRVHDRLRKQYRKLMTADCSPQSPIGETQCS